MARVTRAASHLSAEAVKQQLKHDPLTNLLIVLSLTIGTLATGIRTILSRSTSN